ncbi:MAG: hypothetical protein HYS06_09520 [Methylocystis sp.]|nr:hypothetical protein [Methylocystis sp.]MBI3276036.1 hypothetical protein [Methylocystis sp.]
MFYLLTKDWMWLAPALAIGLAVGWLTTTRQAGARFSGGWVIWTTIVVLGAGFAAAYMEVLPGRNGLLLETAVLLLAAYFVGCPAGGGAKLLLAPKRPTAPAVRKPPPVVLRGSSRAAGTPQPALGTPAPVSKISHVDHDALERKAAAPSASAPGADKKTSGAPPAKLAKPRGGRPDELTRIKGIGPKINETLHALGVWHFDQIAAWTPENVKWVSAALGVPGRIDRGKWVAQAKELADKRATKGNGGAPAESG